MDKTELVSRTLSSLRTQTFAMAMQLRGVEAQLQEPDPNLYYEGGIDYDLDLAYGYAIALCDALQALGDEISRVVHEHADHTSV